MSGIIKRESKGVTKRAVSSEYLFGSPDYDYQLLYSKNNWSLRNQWFNWISNNVASISEFVCINKYFWDIASISLKDKNSVSTAFDLILRFLADCGTVPNDIKNQLFELSTSNSSILESFVTLALLQQSIEDLEFIMEKIIYPNLSNILIDMVTNNNNNDNDSLISDVKSFLLLFAVILPWIDPEMAFNVSIKLLDSIIDCLIYDSTEIRILSAKAILCIADLNKYRWNREIDFDSALNFMSQSVYSNELSWTSDDRKCIKNLYRIFEDGNFTVKSELPTFRVYNHKSEIRNKKISPETGFSSGMVIEFFHEKFGHHFSECFNFSNDGENTRNNRLLNTLERAMNLHPISRNYRYRQETGSSSTERRRK